MKEADKWSAVVILDKTYYQTKTQESSKDETNYKLTDSKIDNNTMSKISKFCKIPCKSLTNKEDSLTNYIPKISNFFGEPKIHKSKQIKTSRRKTKIRIYRNSKTPMTSYLDPQLQAHLTRIIDSPN